MLKQLGQDVAAARAWRSPVHAQAQVVDLKRKPFDLLLELPLGRSKRRMCKTHQLPLDSA